MRAFPKQAASNSLSLSMHTTNVYYYGSVGTMQNVGFYIIANIIMPRVCERKYVEFHVGHFDAKWRKRITRWRWRGNNLIV